MTGPALAVFLKAPRIGTVKTRLAAAVGDRQALRLYRVMAVRTLAAARASGLETTIWFAPADAAGEMYRWLGDSWQLRSQCSGDLGARLSHAAGAVEHGRAWMAIGADCPRLTAERLRGAASVLRNVQFVIIPATDGGYVLIGLAGPHAFAFDEIEWSTPRVFEQTRRNIVACGMSLQSFAPLEDVDDLPSLLRARPHCPALPELGSSGLR